MVRALLLLVMWLGADLQSFCLNVNMSQLLFSRAVAHNIVLDLVPDHQKVKLCLVFSDLYWLMQHSLVHFTEGKHLYFNWFLFSLVGITSILNYFSQSYKFTAVTVKHCLWHGLRCYMNTLYHASHEKSIYVEFAITCSSFKVLRS